ncbi:MAG: flagellar basal body rod protein FlgC [Acidobacteria bacterium]|nr:flagellar basal body rod protein FlgC [Planctomycetota bacterium]MBE3133629.1 flagellar basal body rod protein FlgC [Acidobacteriota bacterium]
MSVEHISPAVDVAVSGLRAQSLRLNLIAGNIANANTTRTDTGQPFRRRDVVLQTAPGDLGGVTILRITQDASDFRSVLMKGHPDADANGFVRMPNVDLPVEMTNLITASRAYQANVAVLKRYQDLVEATMELLR